MTSAARLGVGAAELAAARIPGAARREIEAALDHAGWPWLRRLSLWIDALLVVEETSSPSGPA